MSDLASLWKKMEETNSGTMIIVLDAKGKERSRAIILVDGPEDVAEILETLAGLDKMRNERDADADRMERSAICIEEQTATIAALQQKLDALTQAGEVGEEK